MRGRKPLSTKQKEVSGAFVKNPQRRNKDEPEAPGGEPEKPDYFDEAASRKWDAVVALFREMGMLSRADGDLIELYCVTYSSYRKAVDSVNQTGQVLILRHGELVEAKRNPFSVELHKYADRMKNLLAEMGLTPSSRSRVSAVGSDEPDEFARMLAAMGDDSIIAFPSR